VTRWHDEGRLDLRTEGILQRRAYGWTYREIGPAFGITGDRVSQLMKEVRAALGVRTDADAVAEAVRRGLIDVGGEVERAFGRRPGTVSGGE
jgi:DNA-binding CsgD family transcriptional regulator